MINLNDVAEQAYILAEKRQLDTDVLSTLKHCAGEVVEATEAYTKLQSTPSPNQAEVYIHDTGLELADIIICALTASVKLGIDIETSINEAMQKNARRAYQENNNETA